MFTRALFVLFAAASLAHADLTWDKPVQEYHRVPEDGHVAAKFAFKNTGTTPVTVKRVKTSCGCTSAKLAKNTFAPGESGEIEVKFSFGMRRGPQRKIISAATDDGKEQLLDLRVYIHEPLTLTPALVYWKVGQPAEPKAVKLTIPDGVKLSVKSVKSSDPRVSAKVETVTPGKEYVVNVTPTGTAEKLAAELTIETDFPSDAPRSYRLFARIK